jgi:hypothetical protein
MEAVILSTKHSTLTQVDAALRHWFKLERLRLNVALVIGKGDRVIGKGGETKMGRSRQRTIQAVAYTRPHLCST